jgi:hypothetical protein
MKYLPVLILIAFAFTAQSQVAINSNGSNPHSSAMLDVNSTNKGLLIPRISTAQRTAIASPAAGLLVFDTDMQAIYMYDGQSWRPFAFANETNMQPVERKPIGASPGSWFGYSVAIYNDYAIVGAPQDTVKGETTGAAYIFHKINGSWTQTAKLFAPNGVHGDNFGYRVDIYEDVVAIGAPKKVVGADAGRGRVYIFKRNGDAWDLQIGLIPADGKADDRFGTAIALYKNILVVGAPGRDHSNLEDPGSIYAFAYINNTWEAKGIINAQQPIVNDEFGTYFDFWNYTLAAASTRQVVDNLPCGAVYTFNTNTSASQWIIGEKLVPNVKNEWMLFGRSVAVGDEYIVVGASQYETADRPNAGAWFAYERVNGNWQMYDYDIETAKAKEEMGKAAAVDGKTLYIGSHMYNAHRGRVIIHHEYARDIYHPDPFIPTNFGDVIAAHNGNYIVGGSGEVYFGVFKNSY